MAIATGTAALISAGVSAIGGAAGAIRAGKQRKEAKRAARSQARQIAALEAQRQDVPDFAAGIKDLSSMVTNPFQNLQVATGAAEMQAEQTDIALAQTLDQLRTTGAGAGGATALAQAALQSKQGIAASIQKQEAENAMARAKGQQAMQTAQMSEAIRVQGARAAADAKAFGIQEARLDQQLARAAGQQANFQAQEQAAIGQQAAAISQGISGVGAGLSSFMGTKTTVADKTRELLPSVGTASLSNLYANTGNNINLGTAGTANAGQSFLDKTNYVTQPIKLGP